MNEPPKAPKESAYWHTLKAGLKALFGNRVKITKLPTKPGGAKNG